MGKFFSLLNTGLLSEIHWEPGTIKRGRGVFLDTGLSFT